ncbi:hypothetical protein SAMN05421741_1464 [Paenimyroides ummariense]|uniref:Uncharacterized protein n=1 Tax=Paenimyroides ummariense TaxID=913024 RepID=A0A1I5GNG1_9FLAO|nr:hypothetical protein SAMN05421741_1464 [Paenimyroides ummariense]
MDENSSVESEIEIKEAFTEELLETDRYLE